MPIAKPCTTTPSFKAVTFSLFAKAEKQAAVRKSAREAKRAQKPPKKPRKCRQSHTGVVGFVRRHPVGVGIACSSS
jgi:hypothetical protein